MGAGRNGGGEKLAFFTGGLDKESRPKELSGQAGGQCRRPMRACRKRLPWTPIPRPSWAQYVGSRITSGMEHPISINEKDLEGSQEKSQSWHCPPAGTSWSREGGAAMLRPAFYCPTPIPQGKAGFSRKVLRPLPTMSGPWRHLPGDSGGAPSPAAAALRPPGRAPLGRPGSLARRGPSG